MQSRLENTFSFIYSLIIKRRTKNVFSPCYHPHPLPPLCMLPLAVLSTHCSWLGTSETHWDSDEAVSEACAGSWACAGPWACVAEGDGSETSGEE